jgi:hypothetical protein
MRLSNFHVIGFSYRSNTRDAVGRVSHSWAAFNVATTASSQPSRPEFQHSSLTFGLGILAASNRPSRPEFQHSSPTFSLRILATSNWRASPAVGNTFVDDTDAAAVTTVFFATNGKTFVRSFNCYLRNMSQCRTTHLLIHLSLSDLLRWPDTISLMRFSTWEDPTRAMVVAPATTQRRDNCAM